MPANEFAVYQESFEAGEGLTANQYHGVKMSANREINLCDANTDIPVGILTNAPASGEAGRVHTLGRAIIIAGETLTAGMLVRINSDGHAMQWEAGTDTDMYCIGQCIVGGAITEKITALVNFHTPVREAG